MKKLVFNLLIFSIPFAILGTIYSESIPPIILKAIFAVGLMLIGFQLYNAWRKEERKKNEKERQQEFYNNYGSELTDSKGNAYHYTVCNKNMGRSFAAIGGAFAGMISAGLAELQEYHALHLFVRFSIL